MLEASTRRFDRFAAAVGVALIVLLMMWMARWTGQEGQSAALEAVWVMLTALPAAIGWMAAALGFGWLVTERCCRAKPQAAAQVGVGVATLLAIDAALGALGFLQVGGVIGAWFALVIGWILLFAQIARLPREQRRIGFPPWLVWTAVPALAVLLLAACSAPGWLWVSEFGGYDALSYHLQLPQEWAALGRMQPVEYNVYSFLPGYMEAAYYHLAVIQGGENLRWVYACQFLHALMALACAFSVYQFSARIAGRFAGGISAVLVLVTPWVIVVGSLAYNEMAAALLLAAGLNILTADSLSPARQGLMIGLVCGAACGAKLTAAGLVALPLGLALACTVLPRRWVAAFGAAAISGAIVLAPYLIRNQIACGNPVFPFATSMFGLAHWTPEQVEVWSRGHISAAPVGERLLELWNQFFRYGVGANPDLREPWKPQWAALSWLGLGGIVIGLFSARHRRWSIVLGAMILAQILFWMFATHLKSRFLLPAVVPLAAGCGIGVATITGMLGRRGGERVLPICAAVIVAGLAMIPWRIFLTEAGGNPTAAIGMAEQRTGFNIHESDQNELAAALPEIAVNRTLGPNDRVLLVGQAAPLYFDVERIAYQTTWDRGPFSRAMRSSDDSAQWLKSLRAEGFTHLLVDFAMLERWERAKWNDPLLKAKRVLDFAERFATPLFEYPHGVRLYRLSNDPERIPLAE